MSFRACVGHLENLVWKITNLDTLDALAQHRFEGGEAVKGT